MGKKEGAVTLPHSVLTYLAWEEFSGEDVNIHSYTFRNGMSISLLNGNNAKLNKTGKKPHFMKCPSQCRRKLIIKQQMHNQ